MADLTDHLHPGYQEMLTLLYEVGAAFAYSSTLDARRKHTPLRYAEADFEDEYIRSRIISLAARIRMIDDIDRMRRAGYPDYVDRQVVGTLTKRFGGKEASEGCNLRVVCNKIVHADRLLFSRSDSSSRWDGILAPRIVLEGEEISHAWSCVVEIDTFIHEALDRVMQPTRLHSR